MEKTIIEIENDKGMMTVTVNNEDITEFAHAALVTSFSMLSKFTEVGVAPLALAMTNFLVIADEFGLQDTREYQNVLALSKKLVEAEGVQDLTVD